ncbi:hypothetical protein [Bacillus sp. HMF5848]|nr:hypothetical protein [Bacillus sp. HMF5848]
MANTNNDWVQLLKRVYDKQAATQERPLADTLQHLQKQLDAIVSTR